MKRAVSYGIDILIRNEEENRIDLEKLIAEALEEKGIYVLGVAFTDDLTEDYKKWYKEEWEGIGVEFK